MTADGAMTTFPPKEQIVRDWLPRYTGMHLHEFGHWILLTNFQAYVQAFAEKHDVPIRGTSGPMSAASSQDGVTIINYGMGSPNAATIMDLLTAVHPECVLFLGKCGGLKKSTEVGHFILPTAAIRGDNAGGSWMPPEVPALPSFKLHQYVAGVITQREHAYRTGPIYSTNRRVWEWDEEFRDYLKAVRAIGIDMETATIFIVGHANRIPRGAVLLVSDTPMAPDGVKTEESDRDVSQRFAALHLDVGLEAIRQTRAAGGRIKHFLFEDE
jgi:AMP nucleosidase